MTELPSCFCPFRHRERSCFAKGSSPHGIHGRVLMKFVSHSVEETQRAAAALAGAVRAGDVVMLSGDLGAGKTHFSQGFAAALGIDEPVVSPTFNIVLSYPQGRLPLYHFDLYRLDSEGQLEDIDFYAITEGDGVSLVEWGERFPDAFPDDYLHVNILIGSGGERNAAVEANGSRSRELMEAWEAALPR